MIILGVDPGSLCTGYGVVKLKNNSLTHLASGIIKPASGLPIASRLEIIHDGLYEVVCNYKPTDFSLETAFYGKNVQSALKIGYVRGVALLLAKHNNLKIGEYAPREIKKSVVGKGAASKEQVKFMVTKLLNINTDKMNYDETDALAAAICHSFRKEVTTTSVKSWKTFIDANPDKVIG